MKKTLLFVVVLAIVSATTVPALATSFVYGSCAEIPSQEEAQQILESPTYGIAPNPIPSNPPEDPINLDPEGDGIACNNEGNFTQDTHIPYIEGPEYVNAIGQTSNLVHDPSTNAGFAQYQPSTGPPVAQDITLPR